MKYPVIIVVIAVSIFTLVSFNRPAKNTLIHDYYIQKIKVIRGDLSLFLKNSNNRVPLAVLKTNFLHTRLSYKRLAVLSEYFNPSQSSRLNSPAISRLASDNPDVIIPPDGFQAVEQLLYSDWSDENYKNLDTLLNNINIVLTNIEEEPDLSLQFKPMYVWDALRSTVLRIITLGITGFDSPVAQLSLHEAVASLDGIKEVLSQLKNNGSLKIGFDSLIAQVDSASNYLKKNQNFNKFDRLAFITQYADPLYKQLNFLRIPNAIAYPGGSNPIDSVATSIFDVNAFNINFFSPSQEYWVTPERIALGKKLFNDPILSGTKTRSCASCHNPDKAFADGLKVPLAISENYELKRNSPTLLNCAFQTKFFYDSRVALLEGQFSAVIHNPEEMKGSIEQSELDIRKLPEYVNLFRKAYPDFEEPVTTYNITNAVSNYVRSLVSLNSRFDLYMRGDYKQLKNKEKKGFNLFMGKAKCATCHYIPLFNGLVPPVFNETESEVLGVPATATKKNAKLDEDLGRFDFTKSVIHHYAFKTPTLRNIALTAPYMHNGVYESLEEVMEFYNNGGGNGLHIAPSNQTLPFDKLDLSKKEIKAVIAFMHTLTDSTSSYK